MLTKSKYLDGEQCHLKLWLKDRKLLPEPSLADLHRFKQGYNFQDQVYFLFPEGVDLGELEFKENLEKTKELVKEKKIKLKANVNKEKIKVLSCDLGFFRLANINPPNKEPIPLADISKPYPFICRPRIFLAKTGKRIE